jgi:Ca2+-binding EF-hand superfamily protein
MKADSVRAIFNAFDADGNGTLDKTEVLNALRMWDKSVKITPEYTTPPTHTHAHTSPD